MEYKNVANNSEKIAKNFDHAPAAWSPVTEAAQTTTTTTTSTHYIV